MICRVLLSLSVLLGVPNATAMAAEDSAADETGFVSMFNGQDLTGWEGKPGWWYVEDGAITSQSRLMTSSPWVVTFILTIGLKRR